MGNRDAGKAAVAVLFFLGSLVLAGVAVLALVVEPSLYGVAVGPDADDIAEDPMLQLELEGATANSEVYTDQATEGGWADSGGDHTSEAFRVWEPAGAEGHALLLAAVDAGPAYGVVWRGVECYSGSVRFSGYKDVEADDSLIDADVSALLTTYDGKTKLTVTLSSDGGDTYVNRQNHAYSAPFIAGDPCPADVIDVLRRFQPDV